MITLWCIFTVEQNHFFYSNIGRDSSGSFPRLSLTYNTGFYLFAVYLAIYCMAGILLCLHTAFILPDTVPALNENVCIAVSAESSVHGYRYFYDP